MKILGGNFRNRLFAVPEGIRPVSLRMRRSCFDILKGEIEGKKILDLFAGSGSLGLEALSRGAKEAVFVDSAGKCTDSIVQSLNSLGISGPERAYCRDVFLTIQDFFVRSETFDVVFLDPPYYKGLMKKALQVLEEYDILTPSGYIVGFCYAKDEFSKESGKFSLIVHKKYGQNRLIIYRNNRSF